MDGRITGNYDPFLEHDKISFKMNSKHPINQNQNQKMRNVMLLYIPLCMS